MYSIIERYMSRLSIEEVNRFALQNGINLSEEELNFTYTFVKKNWSQVIASPESLNLKRYKEKFSEENFIKIEQLFQAYSLKYKHFL